MQTEKERRKDLNVDLSKEEDLKVPGVVFYAFMNKRSKYLIPSKKNYFGGVHVPFVMLDNGCSSLLLPLGVEDLEGLHSRFPRNSGFVWTVRRGGSAGILNSLVLNIKSPGGLIKFKCNMGPWEFDISFTRWYLCYEDALNLFNYNVLNKGDEVKLKEFIEEVALLRNTLKRNDIAQRRELALVGQTIIAKYTTIQIDNIYFAININPENYTIDLKPYIQAIQEKEGELDNIPEFNDLVDQEHDEVENYENNFDWDMNDYLGQGFDSSLYERKKVVLPGLTSLRRENLNAYSPSKNSFFGKDENWRFVRFQWENNNIEFGPITLVVKLSDDNMNAQAVAENYFMTISYNSNPQPNIDGKLVRAVVTLYENGSLLGLYHVI